jgi:hypothetical protein
LLALLAFLASRSHAQCPGLNGEARCLALQQLGFQWNELQEREREEQPRAVINRTTVNAADTTRELKKQELGVMHG